MQPDDFIVDNIDIILPVLPLRDMVMFPTMIAPLFVGREKSLVAIESALKVDQQVFVVAQKKSVALQPQLEDLYPVGVIANILQVLRLPNGRLKVLVEGVARAKIKELKQGEDMLRAAVRPVQLEPLPEGHPEQKELIQALTASFESYIASNNLSRALMRDMLKIEDVVALTDTIAAHVDAPLALRQELLETTTALELISKLTAVLQVEQERVQVERSVEKRVRSQIDKTQREYFLNEQLKAVQKELQDVSGEKDDLLELEQQIKDADMTPEALEKSLAELRKLQAMSPMSPEATVLRNYLDWMIKLPWNKYSREEIDLANAEKLLNEQHYGLEKVKERILEYLAVSKRTEKIGASILCLVGPPGVGKTSLAKSIADAMGRKYVRFALGGLSDEAEIRGHRRTYIGAMPGKILQKLTKIKVSNPLFLLDEIDKVSADYRGDPASALLEVLDPEQNYCFNDRYIDVDYDLSKVLFVATANTTNIPAALLDRMEVIRLAGYTEDEKCNIAERHLLPKQKEEHGLKAEELSISLTAIQEIIRVYTREAGVRSLEREIAKICRKVVKELLMAKTDKKIAVTPRNLEKYLGVPKYRYEHSHVQDRIGQATGMAWTEVGGDLLTIEVAIVPGKGDIQSTGRLGDVMQESVKAALTVVRSRAQDLGLEHDFYKQNDVHVHVPEGATPKDGPSAGIAICMALISGLTHIPLRGDVAMTGEITLRGEVLPIGGLKEKLLAAKRGGIKTVIIPEENKRDLAEIPQNVQKDLDIRMVRWIDEVITIALCEQPMPKEVTGIDTVATRAPTKPGDTTDRPGLMN
ncbi:MAG: endopeptidase La [Gammaproteobacteria bacterium]|nr:endopeptidase La [Gammaproteobacteria bacterium]